MIAVIGHLTVDDIVLPDGRTHFATPGGNSLYAALGCGLWGRTVSLLTCKTLDYPTEAWRILEADRRVDASTAAPYPVPSLRQWALYDAGGGRHYVRQSGAPDYLAISPRPEMFPHVDWQSIRFVHLAPMPLVVVHEWISWLERLGSKPYLQLDPHESEIADQPQQWLELMDHLDVFLPSELEAQILSEHGIGLTALAQRLDAHGGVLVLKRGADGNELLRGGTVTETAALSVPEVDPTGCGDAFAGGYMAARAEGCDHLVAAQWGSVSASFALEDYGPQRLFAATTDGARSRWRATMQTIGGCPREAL